MFVGNYYRKHVKKWSRKLICIEITITPKDTKNYQFELFGIVEPDTGLHPGLDVRRLQLLRIVAPPEHRPAQHHLVEN